MGTTVRGAIFPPPEAHEDPETCALTDNLRDGVCLAVLPATIKYLDERAQAEVGWLESLHDSCIPTTLIWGIHDTVAPIRVANYIWATYLRSQASPSAYWVLPVANHYLQHDQQAPLAHLVRLRLYEKIPRDPVN